jgi:hypothetical protein
MSSGRGRTLAERSAASGIGTGARPAAEQGGATAARPHAQHCWVEDHPGSPGRWPGLLVEWRRGGRHGWQGRVVWAVEDDGRSVLLEAWVDAAHLAVAEA